MITAQTNDTATRKAMQPIEVEPALNRAVWQTEWRPQRESEHVVQFYETDIFLLHALTEFISMGLAAGDACILIATPAHRSALAQRLQAVGLDVDTASASGQYVALDASEMLATLMVEGAPEPSRFASVIGQVITRAAANWPRVRAFGEMVALLWTEGQHDAALHLEALWNDLHTRHSFALFCAYPMYGFGGEALTQPLIDICAAHARVIPTESYTALTNTDDQLRAIIQLQQQAQSLQAEIAERKAVEERLRASELRYRRLFETSTDGILIVDSATCTIIDTNPYITTLLGARSEELVGKKLWEIGLFAGPEANLDAFQALHTLQVIQYAHVPLQTNTMQQRDIELVCALYEVDGQQVVQCNLRDIAGRKLAEEERDQLLVRERAARIEAQEAVRMRDMFLSIAAHELRTPLTSLLGNAQLLQRRVERDGSATDREKKGIRVIVDQAKRLSKMILALLDVSRIETGRLSLERAPVDLCMLVRRVVEEIQPALCNHTVTCNTPAGAVMIDGDEVRLEQVLQNLLTNAIKYSPRGGPVIARLEQHAHQVRLSVSDVGIGIPQHDQPHLFQRFYRASNTEVQTMSGMGIGLYVVKEIVTLHGGHVIVDSTEGVGSDFTIILPINATITPQA